MAEDPESTPPPEDVLMDPEFLSRLVVGIGEVSDISGVPKRQIRYWEKKGLVETVSGAEGSTRRFDYLGIKKILLIKELVDEGYRLDAAAEKVETRMERMHEALSKLATRRESDER